MIEVEKKFSLDKQGVKRLTQNAKFLSEKTFTDIYYDSDGYRLTLSNKWLRARDGKYELKVSMNTVPNPKQSDIDQYDEMVDDKEIARELGINSDNLSDKVLKQNGLEPFAEITTIRRKFKKGKFIIDLDELDFGYSLGEIELLVGDKSEMDQALEEIVAFAEENSIELLPTRNKVIEYIRRNDQEHYNKLIDAGLIHEK